MFFYDIEASLASEKLKITQFYRRHTVDGIIKHLIANPKLPLEKLDLGGNLFTEDGVNCLLAAVEKRTDSPLTELFLRGNPGISDKMLERVEEVMAKNAKRIKGSMSGR